jgi:hypothetical protein
MCSPPAPSAEMVAVTVNVPPWPGPTTAVHWLRVQRESALTAVRKVQVSPPPAMLRSRSWLPTTTDATSTSPSMQVTCTGTASSVNQDALSYSATNVIRCRPDSW